MTYLSLPAHAWQGEPTGANQNVLSFAKCRIDDQTYALGDCIYLAPDRYALKTKIKRFEV